MKAAHLFLLIHRSPALVYWSSQFTEGLEVHSSLLKAIPHD